MRTSSEALQKSTEFLQTEVKPISQEIDISADVLRSVLTKMGHADLLALKRPVEFGGPALTEPEFRIFQEQCARYSGTLAFLQTQHQSAAGLIASSPNTELKNAYLPKMGTGEKMVGIGFSQLRRSGPPVMTATPNPQGFILHGSVPWITGFSYYSEFIVGATLPSGEALFAVVPLTRQNGISVSEPMKLAAMEMAMTVSAEFSEFQIDTSKVVITRPPGWIIKNDQINIALQGHFAIGCALGSLDVLEAAYERRKSDAIKSTLEELKSELQKCRDETAKAQHSVEEETTEERLKVRAWAIDLAFRCAQGAIVASSGAANSLKHPAQRLYREALVYAVSAQTTPIMEASLSRLVRQ